MISCVCTPRVSKKWDWLRADVGVLQGFRVAARCLSQFFHGLAAGVEHAGLAYAPQGFSIGQIIRGLMLIQQVLDAEDMVGHVEYL